MGERPITYENYFSQFQGFHLASVCHHTFLAQLAAAAEPALTKACHIESTCLNHGSGPSAALCRASSLWCTSSAQQYSSIRRSSLFPPIISRYVIPVLPPYVWFFNVVSMPEDVTNTSSLTLSFSSANLISSPSLRI
mmetsp:Transcript_28158/g.82981  ORF Transcript_28158/g.82981 Transcript_28158/m.82981 type:complete len:137 (-) Transcript_28158:972-1382(-)